MDLNAMANDTVHIEILQKLDSIADHMTIITAVKSYMKQFQELSSKPEIKFFDPFLSKNICAVSASKEVGNLESHKYKFHVYQLYDMDPADEILENSSDDSLPAATHWTLPSTSFHGLWKTLMFDSDVKTNLLKYAETIMYFAGNGIDPNIISCNKVILLHGPPGTGKTTLCKALAQKICIRFSHIYPQGSLLEINSHSLFSKWFSESGNLVMKMFQKIEELVQGADTFVCVLIDEVESLTAARASHDSGTEPSDAIRVVNALLTQIDKIKKYPNVLILTTSNVTGKLDLAFVDRADVKQYIGLPSASAIYEILRSCIDELMRVGIIMPRVSLPPTYLATTKDSREGEELRRISDKCCGLSGRALRKIPFLVHACFLKTKICNMEEFLQALCKTVDMKFQELKDLKSC